MTKVAVWLFGFLIFIIVERNSLYNSLYILTEKSLKHPCSTRGLGPHVFLSFSLSLSPPLPLSLSLPPANSLESGNPLSSLCCLGFKDLLSRVPCAFVSSASPVLGVLLVLCVNQGILASFSLSFSYRRLQTIRFQSIK